MKIIKRITSLIAVLLLVVAANVCSMDKGPFPMDLLPRDMQREVMVAMANNTISNLPQKPESLKAAAKEVRNVCLTNKELNDIVNKSDFTLQLIKNLAKRFHSGEYAVAKELATKGAQERIKLQDELFELIYKATDFSMDKLEALCNRGADLEFVGKFNETPLMAAADIPDVTIVQALINKGVNVNQKFGPRDYDVLGSVINGIKGSSVDLLNKRIAIIKILLDAGADPRFSEYNGRTAMEMAKLSGNQEVIDLIQGAIEKQSLMTKKGVLAKKGALDLKLQDELDKLISGTAFSLDRFEELCKRGVDLDFVNKFGETPLLLAAQWAADPVIVQALIDKGVNVNQTFGPNKETVLYKLIDTIKSKKGDDRNKWLVIIKMLLDAGADPKFSEDGRATALEAAQRYGQKDVIELMQKAAKK